MPSLEEIEAELLGSNGGSPEPWLTADGRTPTGGLDPTSEHVDLQAIVDQIPR